MSDGTQKVRLRDAIRSVRQGLRGTNDPLTKQEIGFHDKWRLGDPTAVQEKQYQYDPFGLSGPMGSQVRQMFDGSRDTAIQNNSAEDFYTDMYLLSEKNPLAKEWLWNDEEAKNYIPEGYTGFDEYLQSDAYRGTKSKGKDKYVNQDSATVTNTPIIGSPLMETNLDKTRPGWYPGMGNNGYLASSESIPGNAGDIYNAQQAAKGITSALGGILANTGQTGRGGIPVNTVQEKTMSQDNYQDAKNNAAQDRATVTNTPIASVTNTPLSSFASNGAGYISMPSADNMSPEDYERYQARLANVNASSAANAKDKNTATMNWGQPKSKQNINFDWDGNGSPDLDNTSNIGEMIRLSKPSSGSDATDTDTDKTGEQKASQADYEKYGGEDAYKMASNKNQGAKYVLSNLMSGASGGLLKTGATSPQELAGMANYAYRTTGTEGTQNTLAQAQTRANRDAALDLRRQYNEALMGRNFEDELMGNTPEDTPSLSDIEALEKRVTRDDVLAQLGLSNESADENGKISTGDAAEDMLGASANDAASSGYPSVQSSAAAAQHQYIIDHGFKDEQDFEKRASLEDWQNLLALQELVDEGTYQHVYDQYGGVVPWYNWWHSGIAPDLNELVDSGLFEFAQTVDPDFANTLAYGDDLTWVPEFADAATLQQYADTLGLSIQDAKTLFDLADASNASQRNQINDLIYKVLTLNSNDTKDDDVSSIDAQTLSRLLA